MEFHGNEAYFTRVYSQKVGYVRTVLVRIHPHCLPVVDDLIQEVFVGFWQALVKNKIDRTRKPEPFLATLAHNKAIDYLGRTYWRNYRGQNGKPNKKRIIRPKFICLDEIKSVEAKDSNPLEVCLMKEKIEVSGRLAKDCLGYIEDRIQLKKAQCLKRHIGEESNTEIALALKLSKRVVDSSICSMRKDLSNNFREELKQLHEIYED